MFVIGDTTGTKPFLLVFTGFLKHVQQIPGQPLLYPQHSHHSRGIQKETVSLSVAEETQPALPECELLWKPTPVTNCYSPHGQISLPNGDGGCGGGAVATDENTRRSRKQHMQRL